MVEEVKTWRSPLCVYLLTELASPFFRACPGARLSLLLPSLSSSTMWGICPAGQRHTAQTSLPNSGTMVLLGKTIRREERHWLDGEKLRFVLDQIQRRHTLPEGVLYAWHLPKVAFWCATPKTSLTVPITQMGGPECQGAGWHHSRACHSPICTNLWA